MSESWDVRFSNAVTNGKDWDIVGYIMIGLAQEARAGAAWWQAKAESREAENLRLMDRIEWLERQIEALQGRVPVVAGEVD